MDPDSLVLLRLCGHQREYGKFAQQTKGVTVMQVTQHWSVPYSHI